MLTLHETDPSGSKEKAAQGGALNCISEGTTGE